MEILVAKRCWWWEMGPFWGEREIDRCRARLVLRALLLLEIRNARSSFDPPTLTLLDVRL